MKVFSGTANQALAHSICDYIGIKLGKCSVKPFPDGVLLEAVRKGLAMDLEYARGHAKGSGS